MFFLLLNFGFLRAILGNPVCVFGFAYTDYDLLTDNETKTTDHPQTLEYRRNMARITYEKRI